MKRLNLETQILNALYENTKRDNGFMDYHDIGKAIFGNGYISQTYRIFDKMIKGRMFLVREIADRQGILIIPKRKPTTKDKEKRFQILGWKIAMEGDENYITDELTYKINNGEARKSSTLRFANTAVKKGMLESTKILELSQ